MKAFLLSMLIAISTFFGVKKAEIDSPQTMSPPSTVTVIEREQPLDNIADTATPSSTVAIKPSPRIIKPNSSINEKVLKTFFGLQDKQQISYILNTPSEIDSYEKKYYEKFKNYPIPRITIASSTQQIAMPSQNGCVICTGKQLQSLYSEIAKIEEEIEYEKMDYECHYDRAKQKTEECRIWRRDNDQNRPDQAGSLDETVSELQKKINEYTKKIQKQQSTYDRSLEKYCSMN